VFDIFAASVLLAHVQNASHQRTVSPESERSRRIHHQHLVVNFSIHCDRFSFRPAAGRRPIDELTRAQPFFATESAEFNKFVLQDEMNSKLRHA
jgi:hypothetical protein